MNYTPELLVTPEQIKEQFQLKALETIRERFPDEDYHNEEHTLDVVRYTKLILEAIKQADPELVTDVDFLVGESQALIHDMVVKYKVVDGKRSRDKKENERKSAEEGGVMMEETDPEQMVYTKEIIERVKEGVQVTIPEFSMEVLPDPAEKEKLENYLEPDGKALRIWQKGLTENSSITELALALADLSYVGIEDPNTAAMKSDGEFREFNETIRKELSGDRDLIFDDRKKEIKDAIVLWFRWQIQFMAWQKANFNKSVSENLALKKGKDGAAEKALRMLYCRFDENIDHGIARYERCKEQPFEQLVEEIGF
jgi:hypothetical protein